MRNGGEDIPYKDVITESDSVLPFANHVSIDMSDRKRQSVRLIQKQDG